MIKLETGRVKTGLQKNGHDFGAARNVAVGPQVCIAVIYRPDA